MIRPPGPIPMMGADSGALATSSRTLGPLKRALAGGLRVSFTRNPYVRRVSLRVPGARHPLQGESG